MPRPKQATHSPTWQDIASAATKESDPQKFAALVDECIRLLKLNTKGKEVCSRLISHLLDDPRIKVARSPWTRTRREPNLQLRGFANAVAQLVPKIGEGATGAESCGLDCGVVRNSAASN